VKQTKSTSDNSILLSLFEKLFLLIYWLLKQKKKIKNGVIVFLSSLSGSLHYKSSGLILKQHLFLFFRNILILWINFLPSFLSIHSFHPFLFSSSHFFEFTSHSQHSFYFILFICLLINA